jgi:flavodoxin
MDINLIYASTSGNVELVMETVTGVLNEQGFQTHLSRAEQTALEVVVQNKVFVFGTSTWEHGALNPFFVKLIEEMATIDCHGKQAAFVGLGDSRYEPVLFCEGMEKVRRVWLQQGGQEATVALKIQGEPYHQLELKVIPWATRLAATWKNHA